MTHFAEREDYREQSERLITGIAWDVGDIELREGNWLMSSWRQPQRRAMVPRGGLLHRFCSLEHGTTGQIERFARRFGLLRLCAKHNLPNRHEPDCEPRIFEGKSGGYGEHIDQWRRWARRFLGTIEIAKAIQNHRPLSAQDVDDAFEELPGRWEVQVADLLRKPKWWDAPIWDVTSDGQEIRSPQQEWEPQSPEVQLFKLSEWLNSLLVTANVRPQVVQPTGRESLAIVDGPHPVAPLFGVLTLELAAACANIRTLARCRNPGCRRGFAPERISSAYCPKCRHSRVRWNLAQQNRRATLRAKGLSARSRPFKTP
jgi:hypothetical protein